MLSHYLITLHRTVTRHRLYAVIDVLGLAVGIAVFLVLFLDVRFETSFERWIPHANQIYLIRTTVKGPLSSLGTVDQTAGGFLDVLRTDYPQLVGTRVWEGSITMQPGTQPTDENVEFVDPNFFQVFDLPLVSGDKATLLHRPDDIVLTQAKARQYFGAANPLGQRLTISFAGPLRVYRVVGVLKDRPKNSDLDFDFLAPLQVPSDAELPTWRSWSILRTTTYLRFDSSGQARAFDAQLDSFWDRHAASDSNLGPHPSSKMQIHTLPLLSRHLIEPKDQAVVGAIGTVGVLTLLLAVLNYVNLATARAGMRAREVAIRKVTGASRALIAVQFMVEAIIITTFSALVGMALCELALPLVNAAGGLNLKLDYLSNPTLIAATLALVLAVGAGAGLYPALVLSALQPAAVLASARTPGGGRASSRVREALVAVQFAIAIAFAIATGVIVSQVNHLRSADLGFRRDGLIVVSSFSDALNAAQQDSLLNIWRSLPGVVGAAVAEVAPGEGNTTIREFKRPGQKGAATIIDIVKTAPDFFQIYGMRLVAGRLPDRQRADDYPPAPTPGAKPGPSPSSQDIVLNSSGVRLLGFQDAADAIGKTVLQTTDAGFSRHVIIGVVGDFRFGSPQKALPATVYVGADLGAPGNNALAGVRYAGTDPRRVMDRMAAAWRQIVPTKPFRAETADAHVEQYYRSDEQHGLLFIIGALLAVVIACVGLYGLASFNTANRVKEIGIRKTLGASTADVMKLLIGQFLRPVLVANLIAWPLAFLTMRSWLSGFDERIGLGPLYFLGASLLTLAVALCTVAGQTFVVARADPAKALRHD